MKLSIALAALVAMASHSKVAAQYCCVFNPDLDANTLGPGPLVGGSVESIDPGFGIVDLVSGPSAGDPADLCTQSGCESYGVPGSWMDLDAVCKTIQPDYFIGTSASGLELSCLQYNGDGSVNPAPVDDAPWTCAELTLAINLQPGVVGSFGSNGYYCGATQPCKDANAVCGDPHFQLWNEKWYDFHGECDMNLMSEPEFGNGLGLEIQVRSKARYEYSYIESAAIKIGDDVLEVSSFGQYFYNGVSSAKLNGLKMADQFEIEHIIKDKKTSIFNIVTGDGHQGKEMIEIKTFKDLVSVRMVNAYESTFGNAKGMMGNYHTGDMLARDGKTVISDANEFGNEWQVRAEDAQLFQVDRSPQLSRGEKCVMPDTKSASAERRRLGETISLEAAVAACEAVDHVHHENCVYDIMATGDIEIAHAGVF